MSTDTTARLNALEDVTRLLLDVVAQTSPAHRAALHASLSGHIAHLETLAGSPADPDGSRAAAVRAYRVGLPRGTETGGE
ncbi:MAG: hypothetical protein H6981_07180 [Gammaproteobacteria bacterium]|nr:hypothetical protein [Gammaproteobacteria bacterium]